MFYKRLIKHCLLLVTDDYHYFKKRKLKEILWFDRSVQKEGDNLKSQTAALFKRKRLFHTLIPLYTPCDWHLAFNKFTHSFKAT